MNYLMRRDFLADQCHTRVSSTNGAANPYLTSVYLSARRDFPAVRRHMRASRTIGAVKSYFSKNRRRLDLDRLAEEGARSGAPAAAPEQLPQLLPDGHAQVRCPPALAA